VRRFTVLWRVFFCQFFTSESVTSDVHLRQTMVWVLAFILTPCFILLIQLFARYQGLAVWARLIRPNGALARTAAVRLQAADDMLAWVVFVLVTYSMITVGLLAVFVWDALSYDRRDAMVLGPMPLRGADIMLAKLAALGLFLAIAVAPLNLLNSTLFAIESSDLAGTGAMGRHFVACLAATVAGGTFVFAAIVTVRGLAALLSSARVAASMGAVLQFAFVFALLALVILYPSLEPNRIVSTRTAAALPPTWFVALFETMRGTARGTWPETIELARRALIAVPLVLVGAVVVSIAAFRRQTQLALTPSGLGGPLGHVRIARAIARSIAARDQVATATADFVLTTIARNPRQQAPVAISAAVAVAMILVGAARRGGDFTSGAATELVFAVPLMVAFWILIGLRAAFHVPSEIAASWSFFANGPVRSRGYRRGVIAAIVALVAPPAVVVAALIGGLVGGPTALVRHGLFVVASVVGLAELIAYTIDFIPFTRAYQPGHAKLKTRWPIYLGGAYAFSYGLARVEIVAGRNGGRFLIALTAVAAVTAAFELAARRPGSAWSVAPPEELTDDRADVTVLDIGGVVHGAHVGR
jgi:hypothetical protein